jgi:hypothetical protein
VAIVTYRRSLPICAAVTACALVLLPAGAFGVTAHTIAASVSSSGLQGNAGSGQGGVAVSADARFLAFVSDASNLVAGDTNGVADVFVRDQRVNTTTRVSISSGGAQADDASSAQGLAVSPSGRFVTFTSVATNLAPGNDDSSCAPEPCPDVYIRDRRTHTTRMLVPFTGGPMPGHMQLAAGARFYAYDTAGQSDVVRCRRITRVCVVVSVLPPTVIVDEIDANSFLGGISSGGRFVEFQKVGANEAPNATTMVAGGVFVRDVRGHRTRVVTTHAFALANGISPQGRFVLFSSKGALVPGDTNHVRDVFLRDLRTGGTHRISISSAGRQGNRASAGVGISSSGRYCLFESNAKDLVRGDRNRVRDIFLRDRVRGRTIRLNISPSGASANGPPASPPSPTTAAGRSSARPRPTSSRATPTAPATCSSAAPCIGEIGRAVTAATLAVITRHPEVDNWRGGVSVALLLVTDWTTERGDHGAPSRPALRVVRGTTLLMSTEELLAVLDEGPSKTPEPGPDDVVVAIESAPRPPEPIGTQRVVRLTPPPAPPPKPGLFRRLRCGRRGHDPRPHRLTPHGEIVYRCLRCGMPMPGPKP